MSHDTRQIIVYHMIQEVSLYVTGLYAIDDYYIFEQVFLLPSERSSSYNKRTSDSTDFKIDLYQIRETLILDEGMYRGSISH